MLNWLLVVLMELLLVCYLRFRWTHRRILFLASQLPCPPTIPILGNALLFTGGITRVTKNLMKMLTQFPGSFFCFWIGPMPVFVVSDPRDVRVILNSSNTQEKDFFYNKLKPFFGNGLVTSEVPMWKKYRRLMNPIFHPTNLKLFIPDFNDVSRQLCKELESETPLDPREALFNASVDVVLRTVISAKALSSNTKQKAKFVVERVGHLLTYRLFKFWLHVDWVFNILYRKDLKMVFDTMTEFSNDLSKEVLEEKMKRNNSTNNEQTNETEVQWRHNIFNAILEHPDQNSEDHKWTDEIYTVFAGGSDTVVATISFLLITLANYPEVQSKVRAEIIDVMGGDTSEDVSATKLDALKYLECALLETLRFHSVVTGIMRRVTKDTVLHRSSSSYTLPVGSRIFISLYTLGRNPETFTDPEKFLPERFLNMTMEDRNSCYYVTFSSGPRNCIGKNYSMMYMKTVMTHVLRKYHLSSLVKLEHIQYEMKMIMFSKTPLPILFKPIKK